jgi:hypothetical protein
VRLSALAEKEILELSRSTGFKGDMAVIARRRHNPFIKDGKVDVDAYVAFVCQFNEFINHQPKPFKQMMDKDMRL